MGWYVAYLFTIVIGCSVMIFSGLGGNTWQYWTMLSLIILSHIFGDCRGRRL